MIVIITIFILSFVIAMALLPRLIQGVHTRTETITNTDKLESFRSHPTENEHHAITTL